MEDAGMITVTRHAHKRIHERLGLPKRSHQTAAERAYRDGKCHGDYTGRMKRYLDGVYLAREKATHLRVHQGAVWCFAETTLITAMQLPGNLKGLA